MLFKWKWGLLALWLMHISDFVILNWCFALPIRSLFSIFLSIFLLHLLLEASFKIQPRVPPTGKRAESLIQEEGNEASSCLDPPKACLNPFISKGAESPALAARQ